MIFTLLFLFYFIVLYFIVIHYILFFPYIELLSRAATTISRVRRVNIFPTL